MTDKLITLGVYVLMVLGIIGVLTWATWGLWHKDVGKQTVTTTNTIITTQAAATNAAVEKKEATTNGKIAAVQHRAQVSATATRNDRDPDPDAYNRWLDRLCADDIYKGTPDCISHGRQPAGADPSHSGR
jgi:hypothetical protein